MKTLSPADRLIVGIGRDVSQCRDRRETEKYIVKIAKLLRRTGVFLKVETLGRDLGYGVVTLIHDFGLRVFLDAKLYGTKNTLAEDGLLLNKYSPEFLTVACASRLSGMQALKSKLPDTQVLGVSVLTSDTTDPTETSVLVMEDSILADRAGLDGMISPAVHIPFIKSVVKRKMSFVCPAIRPTGVVVPNDDQNPDKIATPREAILLGADHIIVSRPITQCRDMLGMVNRIIEEISKAVEEKEKLKPIM